MGYDVTFHPVSLNDIRRYVFDVVEQPELADSRASDITSDGAKRRHVERVYEELADWVRQLAEGESLPLNETVARAAAQVAGFIHPYWYSRNAAISMLEDDAVLDLFAPLSDLTGAPVCLRAAEPEAHIGLNYTASGVITDVERLERELMRLGLEDKNGSPALFKVFDSERLASLREAIAYCKQHDLALMEASDVVVPIADEASTDPDNLREAEAFDEPSQEGRRWFEPPHQERRPAFERFTQCTDPLLNDTVVVRKLLGRNRVGTLVPLYLVPGLDRKKHNSHFYHAVLFDDGRVEPVRKRRVKFRKRVSSYREYRRRNFEFERSFYEDQAKSHPGPEIQSAKGGMGGIPDWILNTGLTVAFVGEWEIADAIFDKALLAAEIIIDEKHAERDEYSYPGNLAEVLRARWFAEALLNRSPEPEKLIEACEVYRQYAEEMKRSDWHEFVARDYVDFVLTSLVAGRPDFALEMLNLKRPFFDQDELMSVYRSIANARRGSAGSTALAEHSGQLLEVIRHPQGGRFLSHGTLTGIQLALMMDRYLVETPEWKSIRDIVSWLGR